MHLQSLTPGVQEGEEGPAYVEGQWKSRQMVCGVYVCVCVVIVGHPGRH